VKEGLGGRHVLGGAKEIERRGKKGASLGKKRLRSFYNRSSCSGESRATKEKKREKYAPFWLFSELAREGEVRLVEKRGGLYRREGGILRASARTKI